MPAQSAASSPDRVPRYGAGDLVAEKYLLERLLGEGGMGSVWLAHNLDLDAPVAIKLVRADAAVHGGCERLRREARAVARLQHRAVVRVFDCGVTEHGDPFIAMEHLQGMTFADALDQRGPIGAASAVRILLPIIDGLCVAHEQGIVHRDIKPENIFLARTTRHVQPKVVDFGIAKMDRWDPNPSLTLRGSLMGSPAYMAPEQALGQSDVDHRADVWAVCAVLYEAVTGSPPFRGESYNAILRSIIEEEPTPLTGSQEWVAALWAVLERGFTKDRTRRFQTMRELGEALARLLLAHGVTEDVCGDSLAANWDASGEPQESATRFVTGPFGALTAAGDAVMDAVFPPTSGVHLSTDRSSVAPTSTFCLVTPSSRPRERHSHARVGLSAAALMLLATVGSAVSNRSAPGPGDRAVPPAAVALAATPRAPALPIQPVAAAITPVRAITIAEPPVARRMARPRSVALAPTASAPLANPGPPLRPAAAPSARPRVRHGWPTGSTRPTASVGKGLRTPGSLPTGTTRR